MQYEVEVTTAIYKRWRNLQDEMTSVEFEKNEKKFLLKMQKKIIRRIRCKISQRNSVINDKLLYKFNSGVNKVITPCMNILLTSK